VSRHLKESLEQTFRVLEQFENSSRTRELVEEFC
jgi:hypothetical protein